MTTPKPFGSEARDRQDQWLDAQALKAVSVKSVLEHYGLLDALVQRDSTLSGPSPFSEGGVLSVNLEKNVWNDSWGRPQIDGRVVPGNVIGLVQAIEKVPFRRALEILHERFADPQGRAADQTRARTGEALRSEAVQAKAEGNTPFGKELKGLKADVPFLREAGIPPELAKSWGVGWCTRGLLRGRIAFPIRSSAGELMAYAGLSPKADAPEGRWKFPSGFQRSLELFGIDRVHQQEAVREQARDRGLVLVEDPLQVLRLTRQDVLGVVSPMGAELSETQIELLLSTAINPGQRLTLLATEPFRRTWARALIRRAWVRYAEPSD